MKKDVLPAKRFIILSSESDQEATGNTGESRRGPAAILGSCREIFEFDLRDLEDGK